MTGQVFQVPVRIGELPIGLLCRSDSTVALFPLSQFKTFVDCSNEPEGVSGVFDMEGFKLDGMEYDYQTPYAYKNMPVLLKWLQQQKMQMPLPKFN